MRDLLQDLRLAWRTLGRQRLLTGVVVATLGFGIGANAAVFSLVNALLIRPYAFPDLDSLVTLWERHPQQGGQAAVRPSDPGHPLAPADFLDLRREAEALAGVAAVRGRDFTLSGQGEPERLAGALVSPELFGLLGVRPALGRALLPEEALPGRDAVVVVSHGLWQRRLGGRSAVVGSTLVLNGAAHTVVGVMPEEFAYPPGGIELWAPLAFSNAERVERGRLSLRVVGRLAPGASVAAAREELAALARRLADAYPRSNAGRSFALVRLREQQAGLTGPFAALLQGAALFALAGACANVAAVLLARGLQRRREIALRAALGASRWRAARLVLAEGCALSLLGSLVALFVAAAGARAIRAGVPPEITRWVAGWDAIRLDGRVLGFGLAVAGAVALATGLAPALAAARLAPGEALRDGGRGSLGGRRRAAAPIVVTQIALALVLLVGASLMVAGVGRLLDRYEALAPRSLLSFRVRLPEARYLAGREQAEFFRRVLAELASLPAATAVAAVAQLPGDLGPVPGGAVSIRGRSRPGDLDVPMADQQAVSAGYFRALGLRVLRGRGLEEWDGAEAPGVAVVSESMARRLWPDGRALGQHVKTGRVEEPGPWREVVGVVEDVSQYWFDREPRSTLYLPYEQAPRGAMFVLVRIASDPEALWPTLRRRLAALDPLLPIDELRTLRRVVDDGMAFLRLAANLLLLLGAVALGLSALGVYGIVAQEVASRSPELALRLALGARPGDVRRQVLGRAAALAGLGLAAGVPLALALGLAMGKALFGVVRPDPLAIVLFAGGLAGVAILASLAPASRAARLDPAAGLRGE